jgi:hypothetical protein
MRLASHYSGPAHPNPPEAGGWPACASVPTRTAGDATGARALFDRSRARAGPRAIWPVTNSLVTAVLFDVCPDRAAATDFGIHTQNYYETLYHPLSHGDITPEQVDAALGDGHKLTQLVKGAAYNPHCGIVFRTAWDELRPEPEREMGSAAARDEDIGRRPAGQPQKTVATGKGTYQVWRADDFAGMMLSELERQPYVRGHTHVANVQAASPDDAFWLTNYLQSPWEQNQGVQALVDDPGSTSVGDVIVEPKGVAYRAEDDGFAKIDPAASHLPSPSEIAGTAKSAQTKQRNPPPLNERTESSSGKTRLSSPSEVAREPARRPDRPGPRSGKGVGKAPGKEEEDER